MLRSRDLSVSLVLTLVLHTAPVSCDHAREPRTIPYSLITSSHGLKYAATSHSVTELSASSHTHPFGWAIASGRMVKSFILIPSFASGQISVGCAIAKTEDQVLGHSFFIDQTITGRFVRDETTSETLFCFRGVEDRGRMDAVMCIKHLSSTKTLRVQGVCEIDRFLQGDLEDNVRLGQLLIETRNCPVCEQSPDAECDCEIVHTPLKHGMDFEPIAKNLMSHYCDTYSGHGTIYLPRFLTSSVKIRFCADGTVSLRSDVHCSLRCRPSAIFRMLSTFGVVGNELKIASSTSQGFLCDREEAQRIHIAALQGLMRKSGPAREAPTPLPPSLAYSKEAARTSKETQGEADHEHLGGLGVFSVEPTGFLPRTAQVRANGYQLLADLAADSALDQAHALDPGIPGVAHTDGNGSCVPLTERDFLALRAGLSMSTSASGNDATETNAMPTLVTAHGKGTTQDVHGPLSEVSKPSKASQPNAVTQSPPNEFAHVNVPDEQPQTFESILDGSAEEALEDIQGELNEFREWRENKASIAKEREQRALQRKLKNRESAARSNSKRKERLTATRNGLANAMHKVEVLRRTEQALKAENEALRARLAERVE